MRNSLFSGSMKAVRALLTRTIFIECDRIPYEFRGVPLKKILNWIRAEISSMVRFDAPMGLPTHLQVEPTNTCNLNCALCPVSGPMQRPKGHMDVAIFKKLIDEIGEYVFLMLFWDWGEPFFNPDAYQMIATAKQKGIKVVSSTNGHLFADQEHADNVIRSGLDTLIFAVDGISQESYEKYRCNGSLKTALDGIRMVVSRKRALNSPTPFVNLRFLVMKHNEHEVPQLEAFARSLGVDALTLKTLNPCADNTYGEKPNAGLNKENDLLPEGRLYRRFDIAADGKHLVRLSRNRCKNLWNSAAVHWNGVVCPCTYDYNEKFDLGDLKKQSFKEIWFGGPYRRMRRQLRENDARNHFCYECSYTYQGGSCIDETVKKAVFFNNQGGR